MTNNSYKKFGYYYDEVMAELNYDLWLEFIEPEPFIYLVSLIIITIGVLVGMFGSSRAVRKYLKV